MHRSDISHYLWQIALRAQTIVLSHCSTEINS